MIKQLIESTKGRFFKIVFQKRTTGERREMVARIGVSKDIAGTGLRFSPSERNLRVVWDTGKRGYRAVPLDAISFFQCGQTVWSK